MKNQKNKDKNTLYSILYTLYSSNSSGLTLIETLVAITILTVAVVAPMSLTMQSLSAAYYARDQIVASNLAQEALESVRAIRDSNILRLSLNQPEASCTPTDLLCGIPIDTDFIIDARTTPPTITVCGGTCELLRTDGNLYGYGSGWVDTGFRRTARASFTDGTQNEITVRVTVDRVSSTRPPPPVVINANLYRWVEDGSGI